MSFNQFMHPRNIYRRKPNYEQLAHIYPQFGAQLSGGQTGKRPTIDYSDPNALRALTITLLKHDFALDVKIPDGRLVPTLPMRLNYLLWVEDLLRSTIGHDDMMITGFDIGTGCCAIFPLLGVTLNKWWSFIATEIDETNLTFAKMNVEANNYSGRIKVFQATKENMLTQLVNSLPLEKVHFTMTNPPFFSDEYNDSFEEEPKKKHKTSAFHHAKVCTSNSNESVVEGGEVAFVKRIIEESLQVKDRISIYTVMMGRRKSFLEIKHLLKDFQVQNVISSFAQTELCQGNTKRWAIAWTFVRGIQLENAPRIKSIKSKPLLHYIPSCIECCGYDMKSIAEYIKKLLLDDLQIPTFSTIETKKSFEFDIKSNSNTWSNQRKRRRQNKLKESFINAPRDYEDERDANNGVLLDTDRRTTKRSLDVELQEERMEDAERHDAKAETNSKKQKEASDICKSDLTFLLHCGLKVKLDKQHVVLKIVTKEMSQNKDSTFQVLQYLKNKLV